MPRTEMGTFLESPRAEWRERGCVVPLEENSMEVSGVAIKI
jgi:hypothetical protein